jgi:hypothetical protein
VARTFRERRSISRHMSSTYTDGRGDKSVQGQMDRRPVRQNVHSGKSRAAGTSAAGAECRNRMTQSAVSSDITRVWPGPPP